MLSVNRINAQVKITEVWKALNIDPKENSFKTSLPNTNHDERILRSNSNGQLTITGSSQGTLNSYKNDSKKVWNNTPSEITKFMALHPPKQMIKKFVNTLPL